MSILSTFTNEDLKLIIDLCDKVEEEFGRCRTSSERLMTYQIACKANLVLGKEAVSLSHLEMNLEDIIK